jgi:hypothetical protein
MAKIRQTVRQCIKCGVGVALPNWSYCPECTVAGNRERLARTGRQCSKCGVASALPYHRYCRGCFTTSYAEWRRNRSEEARQKQRTRAIATDHRQRGTLKPRPCEHCGSVEVEMHHPDYDQPLQVVWLCRPCHQSIHRELKYVVE